jgi:hypothetical protein
MGWTWEPRPKGLSLKETLMAKATFESGPVKSRALDCAIVKFKTAYLAVEHENREKGTKKIYALVFLLGHDPHSVYDLGYKDVDEEMGPCEDECPERILDLLTPTEVAYALDWRRRCREKIAARKAARPIKTGRWLRLLEPLGFADGTERDTFYVADAKKRRFVEHPGALRWYRLPPKARLAEIGYEVLDADPRRAGAETDPPPTRQPSLLVGPEAA